MELALDAPTLISSGLAIICLVLGSLLILMPTVICIRDSYRLRLRTQIVPSAHSISTYMVVPQYEKQVTDL